MDATTKAAVLRDVTRRMGAGGADITTDEWLDFVGRDVRSACSPSAESHRAKPQPWLLHP